MIAIIGVLVSLLLPAIQASREAARRTQCLNNLRQIGLAVLNYSNAKHTLPAGYEIRIDSNKSNGNKGIIVNGFFPLILPYVEQSNLQATYDENQGYDHVVNQPAVNTPVAIFQCPSTPGERTMDIINSFSLFSPKQGRTGQATDYFGIRAIHDAAGVRFKGAIRAIFPPAFGGEPEEPLRIAQITDGTSNTILLIEMAGRPERYFRGEPIGRQDYYAGTWAGVNAEMLYSISPEAKTEPIRGDCLMKCNSFYNPFSFHPVGVTMMFCDGSAHVLKEDIEWALWQRLVQPDDGENIGAY